MQKGNVILKLTWYYNRLKSMSAGEIAWRLKKLSWQMSNRIFNKAHASSFAKSCSGTTRIVDMISETSFYGLADINKKDCLPEWVCSTIESADRLMDHRFKYLALGEICLGDEIDFNYEYKHNIKTPLVYAPWMDYRDTQSYGDFKYFWEVPRLQHLITLSKAYYLTGKDEYADEVVKQLEAFIEQCPYLLGVNWTMPMEPAIRLISISWITAFIKDYLSSRPQACNLMELIINSHLGYITKNYAAFSSANNHLVGEAAGAFVASICFSGMKGMDRVRQQAYEILCREIKHQHYLDGVNKEQAVHYQIFCFDFFLISGLLGRANGIDFPAEYWDILEKSASFISAVSNDDLSIKQIGDSDDGKVVVLSEGQYEEAHSILAASAVLFSRKDFAEQAKVFDERSFWLLGENAKSKFDDVKKISDSEQNPDSFSEGGYYVLGGAPVEAKIIFDCGPLGFESIAAHGHADSLSFTLDAYGKQFLVDPGTYTYVADDPFRDYFRSTSAHNTVAIDGKDQSKIAGAFLWKTKADSVLEGFESSELFDKVTGWHDGYCRLDDPVIHRRSVELNKKESVILVEDRIESKASHSIEQYFHLSPDCEIKDSGNNSYQIINGDDAIVVTFDSKMDIEIISGSVEPIGGWVSYVYDRKIASNTIRCYAVLEGDQTLLTRIVLAHSK